MKKKKQFKLSENIKPYIKICLMSLSMILIILVIVLLVYQYNHEHGRYKVNRLPIEIRDEYKQISFEATRDDQKVFKEIVFNNMTEDELIEQINKSLSSTLANTGEIFVRRSLELGIDPYVAVAISLYETGCKWGCSYLTRECYNIGGIKGSPGCNGGSFKRFDSLEEGINSYLNLIAEYYKNGMDTPEKMEYRYAGGSTTWASKVNAYIESIKSK